MSGALSGQTALVTGATGAIARASAIALARDGAHLVLMARRPEGLEQARAEIAAAVPGTHIALEVGDCIDSEAVARACKAAWVIAERLDIVFATVGGGSFAPILESPGKVSGAAPEDRNTREPPSGISGTAWRSA